MEHDERVVEYFVVATAKLDESQAELEFAYPDEDENTREFCESVTMFMFPHAFGQDWDKRGLPPPPMHNIFALTDVNGDHLYGASLCFYETLVVPSDAQQINNNDEDNNNNSSSTGVQYQAKSICLLSKRPFYIQLLRYLEQLFMLGTRQSRVNADFSSAENATMRWYGVEKTMCNIFHEVPVPYRGLAVQVTVADVEIVLERPLLQEFPFEMDAELMTYAFMMVEPKVMLQLYHHVLLEHRILIVCADSVLVTAIAEAIKCLVFPLTWLHVYIPNIPDSLDLSTLLEAPVPFIAGAHTRQLEHVVIPDNVVKLEFILGKFVLDAAALEISLPALPEASQKVAQKLGTIRLPDFSSQKREFHEKLWDRRIQLQKMCMSTMATTVMSSSQNSSGSSSSSILSKPLFLTRPNALYKKAMKLYLEIMAALLQDYPLFVSNDGNQAAFDAERFIERKPANERRFYREFVHTAVFQSFLAQHNDHMSGSLQQDDAIKLHFVHRRLLNDDARDFRGSFAMNSASKTFVAHAPQLPVLPMSKRKKSFVLPSRTSISGVQSAKGRPSITLEPVNVSICFPELNVNAFGGPRKIIFPTLSNDAATSSLGTFLKTTSTSNQPSKDPGMEWMQQIMKSVSMPTVPFKKPDFMVNSDLPAAFKRSRTIDRIGKSIPSSLFYRTMTQKALESTNSIFGVVNHTHTLKQDQHTRADPVVKSIWLVTISACSCKDQVVELTKTLTQVLRHHEKNSSHASEAYCQLIDCLGTCGHPSEAKAVFEECLSGSHLISLEKIASQRYFWKPFSSLMRCYIANGLVQRVFDVMVQVKIEEEQHLDPSLGSLSFGAQVLSSESEVLVERIYTTFSCGNIGIYLAACDSGVGAEVLAFETPGDENGDSNNDNNGNGCDAQETSLRPSAFDEMRNAATCVKEGDAVETINGEVVLQYSLARIVNCLKQAYRPMTITFLRGLAKIEGCLTATSSTSNESNNSSDVTSSNFHRTGGGNGVMVQDEQQFRPRKDLCDRFGLLPQKGIRITTLADCTSCGSRASLSEIQEGWSASDANDYTSRCASCGHRYVPRLCVMLGVMTAFYQPTPDSNGTTAEIRVEQFEYLSMLVIRKELANLSQKIPLTMLSMAELREMNPRIYWNIVVKLLSLSCPLDFLDLPDMTKTESGPNTEMVTSKELLTADHDTGPTKENSDGQCEISPLTPVDSELQELQLCFMRMLRKIKSTSGSSDSWEVLASQMLDQLEKYARDNLEGSGVKVPLGSVQDGGDGNNEDALTECDEAEERRNCRTTSVAEPANEGEDANNDEEPCGRTEFDADVKAALISPTLPEEVLIVEKELLRMPESPHLAPFQRDLNVFHSIVADNQRKRALLFLLWPENEMETTRASDDEAAAATSTAVLPSQAGQRVVWNKAKGEFDLQPIRRELRREEEPSESSFSHTTMKRDVLTTTELLDVALSKFEIDQFRHEASFLAFQSTRSHLTERIHSSSSPMKYLPKFLPKWSALLDFFSESKGATAADQYWTSLCEELLEIAQSFKSMGDVKDARAHLGKCIVLARRHSHTSQEEPAVVAAVSSEGVLDKAKKALFECTKFQESLANCQRLLLRSKAPPQVLGYLVRETDLLSAKAPFSIEIVRIKTDLLWKTRQYAAIVNCSSSPSSLTEMDACLTFTYACALENLSLYQQSLNAVAKWEENKSPSPELDHIVPSTTTRPEDTVAALHSHKQRLTLLLACKSTAEQLQRDEKYQDAASLYSQCVALLGSDGNNSFRASLLFHRANMTLMVMHSSVTATAAKEASRVLSSAISDLVLSLKLNPSNQLAKLCLDTALLQLETEKLRSRIK